MKEILDEIGIDIMTIKSIRFDGWLEAFTRRKIIRNDEVSMLAKVLTTLDLIALGVGSTLGVGVYVLAGDVAKNTAGPAVAISFLIAALASILAGLCYAEFGARVPKAGSAYVYSYVCIGELFAFIIGWNLILEYLIGSATVTKALFSYLDELTSNKMSIFFETNMPMNGPEISNYADIFSLALAFLFAVAIAFGAKESTMVNNIFTLVNLLVVSTVIVSGLWKIKPSNWNIPKSEVPPGMGNGGFAPYGIHGIIKGAARCFFGFIGFDCIATAGEEAKNPQRSIPFGVVGSLLIVFFAYFGSSAVLTMMVPYYDQNPKAPLPYVYEKVGWSALKYVVSVGALCGLLSSLLGSMFPLPRIIYAMASDGLIFKILSKVHPKFHTPFMGTLIGGAVTGVLACLFDLDKLTNMMSIGTLLAYSMVAACVLILRYSIDEPSKKFEDHSKISFKEYVVQTFNKNLKTPTPVSASTVSVLVFLYFCFCFITAGLLSIFEKDLERGEAWLVTLLTLLFIVLFAILFLISIQPKSSVKLTFTVPFVPWVPGISIMINIYLMTTLSPDTWVKYAYWMIIGFVIYFTYGIWHSAERKTKMEDIIKKESFTKMET